MALEVVDRHERQRTGVGERLREVEPHEQRAGQPRPVGHGHRVDLVEAAGCARQRLVQHGDHRLHVLARGQLRDHAAVFGVQLDLRRDDVRANAPAVLDDRHGGLVARGLDAED